MNYLLWRFYGTRGVAIAGFLGGPVNSTAAVAELAGRAREAGAAFVATAYRGVLLATAAMLLRNAVLLGLLSFGVLARSALPFALMLAASVGTAWVRLRSVVSDDGEAPALHLESPFSLKSP